MKMKMLVDGNDGTKGYAVGDTYEGDGEWARRVLINGLAEPLDDAAEKIVASTAQQSRYQSDALAGVAGTINNDAE